MTQREHIEQLVEKFLDGRTTNAEERELYAWFRSNDVGEEWAELKAMFAWYEAGMPEQEAEQKPQLELRASRPERRGLWIAVGAVAGVAASLVVALMVWLTFDNSQHNDLSIYAGSYIVDGGVRYDNIEDIENDIEEMLERAERIEQSADELIAWAQL